MSMFGFPFTPTWPIRGGYVSPRTDARFDTLTMSTEYPLGPFHNSPFEPPYEMKHGFGDQNSANLYPTDGSFVPQQTGLFGPLFGYQTNQTSCPPALGVGPLVQPPGSQAYGLMPPAPAPVAGFVSANPFRTQAWPNPPAMKCPVAQNAPYPNVYNH